MIEYRSFHNSDPPRILQLWHSSSLGPNAAEGFGCDIMELFTFSQPYFDRKGFIVATVDRRIVGMVHAGFPANSDESALDKTRGLLCGLIVHPDFRRQGIGRELVRRAEDYLRAAGATTVEAGAGGEANGFYVGIYGGLQPSGFSAADAPWQEFFTAMGYGPGTETLIMRRDLAKTRDPVSSRLLRARRNVNMVITDRVSDNTWWWFSRFGHLDSLRFELRENGTTRTVAHGQIIGMDVFIPKWGVRAVGIRDVFVPEEFRRQAYGLSLVLDICRRLRDETIHLVESHVDATNTAAEQLFRQARFECTDRLVTFRRSLISSEG
ncbi:MAG: GNAT family N-acetyltransferase [Planctomycetaceae bacterium]|nr:GNAT family N-acetyltransferase [Planctomycetaceae bacterium]